jgi:hypothetical protein
MKKETVLEIAGNFLDNKGIDFHYYSNSEEGELLTANWNDLDQDKYDQLEDILKRFDIELDWDDEWDRCYECGKGVRISPTHYGWRPEFVVDCEGYRVCKECFEKDPEEYIEFYKENTNAAFHSWAIPTLEKLGYKESDNTYETGFHPGQTDDPENIRHMLLSAGIYDFVFVVKSVGQFDVNWTVFIKEGD